MRRLESRESTGVSSWLGALLLAMVMLFHSACASGVPLGGPAVGRASESPEVKPLTRPPAARATGPLILGEVGVLMPGRASVRRVRVEKDEFQDSHM